MKLCEMVLAFHHRPRATSQREGASTSSSPCNRASAINTVSHRGCRRNRPPPSPPVSVYRAPRASPSPPSEGGEDWGEEGSLVRRCARVSAIECPSPRSFLTGREFPDVLRARYP